MMSVGDFSARMGLDEEAVRLALGAEDHRDEPVWYVQLVLGIGAWITAIAGLAFVATFMMEILDIDEPGIGIAALGALLFGAAYWPLRRRPAGEFIKQMLIAAASCGAGLGVLGVGAQTESIWLALVVAIGFLLAVVRDGGPSLLQLLLASLAVALAMLGIFDDAERAGMALVSLFLPAGVVLILFPPRWDVRASAIVLTLAFPAMLFAAPIVGSAVLPTTVWFARFVCTATLAFLIALHLRGDRDLLRRHPLAVAFLGLGVLASALLPPGLTAMLAVMLLGHLLGRRSLAILGSVAFVYFLWSFYVDLHQTLLVKSLILMTVGAATLLARAALPDGAGSERTP